MAGRRKTIYSDELAAEICLRVSCGETITDICDERNMPSQKTVYRWAQERADFAEKLDRARIDQMHTWQDQMVSLADDATSDFRVVVPRKGEIDPKKEVVVQLDKRHIDRAKVQIQTRQWMMERLLEKFQPKQKFDMVHSYSEMDSRELVGELRAAFEETGLSAEEFVGLLTGELTLN